MNLIVKQSSKPLAQGTKPDQFKPHPLRIKSKADRETASVTPREVTDPQSSAVIQI